MSSNTDLIPISRLFNGLLRKFNPEKSDGLSITYKFIFKDCSEVVYLQVKNRTAKLLSEAEAPEKIDTTLTTTHDVWQKICFRDLSGRKALILGKIKCSGSLKNFALIPEIFDREL